MEILPRVIDSQIDRAIKELPAVAVAGAKAVGKSVSAERVAGSAVRLDNPDEMALLRADRTRIDRLKPPVLIDEWQYDPPIWDSVRRSVDSDGDPGRFILTGSANPKNTKIHSGAGRIVQIRMRPLSIAERVLEQPTVSLSRLLTQENEPVEGETELGLEDYVHEICASGFPGIRRGEPGARNGRLKSYLDFALSHEVPALGSVVRRPMALRAWLMAYAAASSSTASFESIADAVSKETRPSRATILDYREALTQLWLLDEIPAWVPPGLELSRLGQAPKHQLVDPALAAILLRATPEQLLSASSRGDRSTFKGLRKESLLGALFESLVALSVRVYAEAVDCSVSHLRTYRGEHEVDLIIEAPDGRIIPIEVKLAQEVRSNDVKHLNWLQEQIGDEVTDKIVITSGRYAYRREDGVAVIPLALLGP